MYAVCVNGEKLVSLYGEEIWPLFDDYIFIPILEENIDKIRVYKSRGEAGDVANLLNVEDQQNSYCEVELVYCLPDDVKEDVLDWQLEDENYSDSYKDELLDDFCRFLEKQLEKLGVCVEVCYGEISSGMVNEYIDKLDVVDDILNAYFKTT